MTILRFLKSRDAKSYPTVGSLEYTNIQPRPSPVDFIS